MATVLFLDAREKNAAKMVVSRYAAFKDSLDKLYEAIESNPSGHETSGFTPLTVMLLGIDQHVGTRVKEIAAAYNLKEDGSDG